MDHMSHTLVWYRTHGFLEPPCSGNRHFIELLVFLKTFEPWFSCLVIHCINTFTRALSLNAVYWRGGSTHRQVTGFQVAALREERRKVWSETRRGSSTEQIQLHAVAHELQMVSHLTNVVCFDILSMSERIQM